jgi:hypothetical protein
MNKQIVLNQMREVYSKQSKCYDYRSEHWINRKDAYAIMKRAVPKGYNEFKAELILDFPEHAEFQLAREGSVCMYVRGHDLPSKRDLQADEYEVNTDGVTRVWWD